MAKEIKNLAEANKISEMSLRWAREELGIITGRRNIPTGSVDAYLDIPVLWSEYKKKDYAYKINFYLLTSTENIFTKSRFYVVRLISGQRENKDKCIYSIAGSC